MAGILKKFFAALTTPDDQYERVADDVQHQCQYADLDGERCPIIVPANQGYRPPGAVYCGNEHARLAQEDAPM
ncbi:hypothetical protein HYG77_04675 [Rhodococcus sp. ZPP]|uniref:hypothetical protein n=1 Tax=Rhodococcus sp. ZPP TaxID=2749906 RepID=UPI001AD89E74|nr:hypothetical protein [Rhodococcus sp. ZPP]QTJ64960.1 hypothetical protein HYG77_04675 [Rhodococcus sp. ZPP]